MKKVFPLLLLTLATASARAQSTITVLKDSLTGYMSMRAADSKIRLINWLGGNHYTVDTATGALSVFAQTDTMGVGTTKQYNAQPDYLFSLNGRYPVRMNDFAVQSNSRLVSIGANGIVDTLFGYTTGVGIKHFPVDTLMWLTNDNKLYASNLLNRTTLIDSSRTSDFVGEETKPGHGGVYYILRKDMNAPSGHDSFILYHHNGVVRKRVFASYIFVSQPQTIGMYNGDFYFADVVGSTVATSNRSVSLKKVSAAGVVTALTTFPTGAGAADGDFAIGAGKIWFAVNGINGISGRNFYAYDLQTNTVTQATAHVGNMSVMPFINNGSISADSFLYYRVLGSGFGAPDTLYRTKGSPATTARYGTVRNPGLYFLDSTMQSYGNAYQSFCANYPIFHNYDTLRIGMDTGFVYSGFGTSFQNSFIDWTKLGNSYYCMKSLGTVGGVYYSRIYKYIGCGIPQILLGVEETQMVFGAAQTFPNPSHGAFQVQHQKLNHEAKAYLFSLDGKLQSIQTATGIGVLEIMSNNLPAGIYLLKVVQGKEQFTQRIEIL